MPSLNLFALYRSILVQFRPKVASILSGLFLFMWATWGLPHTITFHYVLLSLGSLLGLYVIGRNLQVFRHKTSLPIYLLGLLIVVATLRFLLWCNSCELQWIEYSGIWKRIIWGAPFAIGLGIAMRHEDSVQKVKLKRSIIYSGGKFNWILLYVGFSLPTLIYLLRVTLTHISIQLDLELTPAALILYPPSSWYIPKTTYVFFCLPFLAICCSQIACLTTQGHKFNKLILLHLSGVACVLLTFFLEGIKNGLVYSGVLLLGMALVIILHSIKQFGARRHSLITLILLLCVGIASFYISKSSHWNNFYSDVQFAVINLEKNEAWKNIDGKPYPKNHLGIQVVDSNYERTSWGLAALKLLKEYPLGYGLIHGSFGEIAAKKWPGAKLSQSHSGWLDLLLGIGFPGVILLLVAAILAAKNTQRQIASDKKNFAFWALFSFALMMITTELSQRIFFEALIFYILWLSSLGLSVNNKHESNR